MKKVMTMKKVLVSLSLLVVSQMTLAAGYQLSDAYTTNGNLDSAISYCKGLNTASVNPNYWYIPTLTELLAAIADGGNIDGIAKGSYIWTRDISPLGDSISSFIVYAPNPESRKMPMKVVDTMDDNEKHLAICVRPN